VAFDLADSLTYKLGPLPAWVWGLGAGGVVLGVQAFRRSRQPAAVEPGADGTAPDATAPDLTAQLDPFADNQVSWSPMGGGSWATAPSVVDPPSSSTAPGDEPNRPTTNDQWRRQATDLLIASNFAPTLAADAIAKYLDGLALTAQQKAAVSFALRAIGAPPSGAPSIIDLPTPPVVPVPPTRRPPSVPVNVQAFKVTATGATLSWSPPAAPGTSPVTEYLVRVSVNGGASWSDRHVPHSPVIVTGAPNGTQPTRVLISARSAAGSSVAVPYTFTTTKPATKPPTPAPKPPPKPPPAPAPKPTPAPAPNPAPAAVRVVRSGDTLWQMVGAVYGRVTPTAVAQVARANAMTLIGSGTAARPSPWRIGQTVTFPAASVMRF
jgi:hypothetical protein